MNIYAAKIILFSDFTKHAVQKSYNAYKKAPEIGGLSFKRYELRSLHSAPVYLPTKRMTPEEPSVMR